MFSSAATYLSLGLVLASSATAALIEVQVGDAQGSTVYSPESVSAQPGDQVVFTFHQKNHTVSQSSFADPCALTDGGFDSGFMPVPANQTDGFPTWTLTVNDTNPIWVYCKQAAHTPASHCGMGMVFAVNCGADGSPNSFSNFKAAALAEGAALSASAAAASTAVSAASSTDAGLTTADYGTATIPAAPTAVVVTETVTVEASTWTTVYSSYPGSPAATPVSIDGAVHTIVVGGSNGELTYSPSNITAAPRDVVVFEFHQKNHTATQSAFAAPCVREKDASGNVIGLDSGFMPVAANATMFPTWNLTVNDTTPIWVYCRQHAPDGSAHCGAGMVFSINAVETSPRSFEAFQALAKQLNGTNSTSTSSTSSVGPSASGTGSGNTSSGTSSFAINTALALSAVAAAVAVLL